MFVRVSREFNGKKCTHFVCAVTFQGVEMKFLILLIAAASIAVAETNDVTKIKVTGDRVSLRAQPTLEGELLDRAMRGEEMVYFERTNGWVAVQAPDSLNFWVAAEFIKDGVVQPKKLNIRSGPSRNYNVVAVVERDDVLSLRGEFNEWLKIAPPIGSRVWISADYVEMIELPKPEPVVDPEPEPEVEEEPKAEEVKKEAVPSFLMSLDNSRKQGLYEEYPGIIRRANPGLYKLVLKTDTFEETICLIKGEIQQMEEYLNYPVLLKGKIYWVKDIDVPIMIPKYIVPNPLVAE